MRQVDRESAIAARGNLENVKLVRSTLNARQSRFISLEIGSKHFWIEAVLEPQSPLILDASKTCFYHVVWLRTFCI